MRAPRSGRTGSGVALRRTRHGRRELVLFALLLLWGAAALASVTGQTISLGGRVLDAEGRPLAGARVAFSGREVTTDQAGRYLLAGLARMNGILDVSRPGYRSELLPIHLLKSGTEDRVDVEPVILTTEAADTARFLFGGDTAFGRRYLDPQSTTARNEIPPDNSEALILASNPVPGSKQVVQFIRPFFQRVDWGVLNLETPLTLDPSTPHPEKDYAFFTLPQSLAAIDWLGVDYVSLGNNHVYDYLEAGVADTLFHLDTIGLPHSGAGLDSEEAFRPYRFGLRGTNYSLLSMTSVSGSQHAINYVAGESKGGAADLRDSAAVRSSIARELTDGFIPIVQLHGGAEYSFEPSAYFLSKMRLAVEAGAGLVIGHHPHVAQGVGLIEGVVTVHSLGNLIFDQARLETMLGLLARVDMQAGSVDAMRLIPVYIEDYQPRAISGELANRFLRRIGEFSKDYGTLVYPYNGQGWVDFSPATPVQVDRTAIIDLNIPHHGTAFIDLRQLSDSAESLHKVISTEAGLSLQPGRDLMLHGDFEDWDIDDQHLEAARWDMAPISNDICTTSPLRGAAALCSARRATNTADSVTAFRNRIRVMGEVTDNPNKDLSLMGYVRGTNAGAINIVSRYYASVGSKTFGEEIAYSHPGGSFDWQPIQVDLQMPIDEAEIDDLENNPRALRLFVRQSPPQSGDALAMFDDLAIVNWDQAVDPFEQVEFSTPHAKDFLRVQGRPGDYRLALTFRSYRPSGGSSVAPDVRADGKDFLIGQAAATEAAVSVALDQRRMAASPVDWWVWAETEQGATFSYVYPEGWRVGESPTVQAQPIDLPPFEIFRGSLPAGFYQVHFCIDDNNDGVRDCTWQDSAGLLLD